LQTCGKVDIIKLMIENIEKYEEEIKKIWLEWRSKESAWEIFNKRLNKYFTPGWGGGNPDWVYFLRLIKKWKREEREKKSIEDLTDEEILDIQKENRGRTILLLKKILDEAERQPNLWKKTTLNQITRLYQVVQAAEEAAKRTAIAAHKEKRETLAMLLPYKNMSVEEIIQLKNAFLDGIDQILRLKSGGEASTSDNTAGKT